MAKKELKVEKLEAKEEKLVAVEMTEAQKAKFVDFIADEEEAAVVAPVVPEKVFELMLTTKHNINGRSFGPGKTRIPESLLGLLMDQENKHKSAEIKLQFSEKKTVQLAAVMGSHTPTQVG